jgi:hypothetical protein
MKTVNIKSILKLSLITLLITSCSSDDDGMKGPDPINLSATYVQEDHMGRPGINTVLGGAVKNNFNVTIPSEMQATFAAGFTDQINGLHAAFGATYENNILGLDAATLGAVLAADVLQVAPNAPTTYFGGGLALTGRNLTDDVIDVSLILLFGGETGDRFNGENGTPELVSDNVSANVVPMANFPYLEAPVN